MCFFCSLWWVWDTSLWGKKVETTGITLRDMLLRITTKSTFPTVMPKELLGAQDSVGLSLKYISAFKDTKYACYYPILSIKVSKSLLAKRRNACDKTPVFYSCLFFLNQANKNSAEPHNHLNDCISCDSETERDFLKLNIQGWGRSLMIVTAFLI